MEKNSILPIIDLLLKAIVVLVSSVIGLKYLRTLTPSIRITIEEKFIDDHLLLIRIKITNVSNIGVIKDKILLQVESLPMIISSTTLKLNDPLANEWVSFQDATEIFKTTKSIDPKEELYLERLYSINKEKIYHFGVRVLVGVPKISKILSNIWPYTDKWTHTKFISFKTNR